MPSTSTTRKGKVFVVGTNEVITSAAVTAILCGEGREDDDECISRDEIDSTPNPVNWSLRTRYYSAELQIFHHSITTEADDDDAGKEDDRNDATKKKKRTQMNLSFAEASEFSAVVMACKCDNAVDFSLLKAYIETNRAVFSNLIAAVDGEEVDATRLLLVDGTDDIDIAEVNPFITQWCLLNNIEPVRVSLLSRNADDTLREVGQRLGDPQGVQRVVDALSATKWPGLILNNARGSNQNASTNSARSESTEEVNVDSDDDLDFMMRERRAENGQKTSSSGRGANASRNSGGNNNNSNNNNNIGNVIDEDDLSFFGTDGELISKIKAISERAQRGASEMTDDERRKAAFSAIEELMSAFKDLDPLEEFNPLPTSAEEIRKEIEEVAGSFSARSTRGVHDDIDDNDPSSSSD